MLCCLNSGVGPDLMDAAVHEGLRGEPGILTDRTAENRSCLEGAAPPGPPLNAQNASSVSGPTSIMDAGFGELGLSPDTCVIDGGTRKKQLASTCIMLKSWGLQDPSYIRPRNERAWTFLEFML